MRGGDCNVCINGKLPPDSATCVECGLSRKNYKTITNADRIRSMTDEELAHLLHSAEEHLFTGNLWNYEKWTEWLKQEADDAT